LFIHNISLLLFEKTPMMIWSLCCACALGANEASSVEPPRPNVVIILADDMGYGDPKCYNPESKIDTPNIDRLAAEGMRFTDAHSCGAVCVPSRYALLTGRYPFRMPSSAWRKRALIERGRTTIASFLKQQGYLTGCIGKWHLGFDEGIVPVKSKTLSGGPVHRGFSTFFGQPGSLDQPPYFYIRNNQAVALPTERIGDSASPDWKPPQGAFFRKGPIAPGFRHIDVSPKYTSEAVETITKYGQGTRDKPFLLYVALPSPHTPWLPTQRFQGKSRIGMYGDFVMQVDDTVGQILAALDKQQLTKNTLTIFSSDNGPIWFREDIAKYKHRSTDKYRGIKGDAWEGGHRVPFIARWPGHVKPASSSDQMICHADMLATLAGLLKVSLPHGAGQDSYSFSPVLTGQTTGKPVRETLIVQSGKRVLAIREGPWKLIPVLGSAGFIRAKKVKAQPGGPTGQLYNLDRDPSETTNLWKSHPQIVRRLEGLLAAEKNRGDVEIKQR